jgi:hypothetical protein
MSTFEVETLKFRWVRLSEYILQLSTCLVRSRMELVQYPIQTAFEKFLELIKCFACHVCRALSPYIK